MNWFFLLIILLTIPMVYAQSDSISLLTVNGVENETGGIATITLEIKPGTGKIYLDSFPLTKLDTQISTRYANQIACDYLKEDCQRYDFFYTIRADASIVGGPSAGAAITILTISVLEADKLNKNTIITGTINSGGLIGPVAGLDEKISAAIQNDFEKVLIPKWQSDINLTIIKERNPDKAITIIKVKTLDEAIFYFTGKTPRKNGKDLEISEEYSKKMQEVAQELCDRSEKLLEHVEKDNSELYNISLDFLNKSQNAGENHYSKASYCFSANLKLRELEMILYNQTELLEILNKTKDEHEKLISEIHEKNIETISQFQTYIVVMERLNQAEESIKLINQENISGKLVAYASERLYSAKAWSEFFDIEGQKINLDTKHLTEACLRKVAEAEERTSYIELYIPLEFTGNMKNNLKEAFEDYKNKDYIMCIFKAGKAKAEANMMLTVLTINEDELETVLLEKFEAIKEIVIEQEEKNMFPILGYSYYEYAASLLTHDKISSLTFTEYALEFSRLDLYFPSDTKPRFISNFGSFRIFFAGFLAGILVIRLMSRKKNPGRFQERRNLPGKKR